MKSTEKEIKNPWYSLRRYYVDKFFLEHIPQLPNNLKILDIGGHKYNKRGVFNIEEYNKNVTYVNISPEKNPDIIADASDLPVADESYDVIICAELLEHVSDPIKVLKEAYRVLKKDGILLITAPFLFRIHADPYDYGRYTDNYWLENLSKIGFRDININKQGLFWSVLVDMIRDYFYQMQKDGKIKTKLLRKITDFIIYKFKNTAVKLDSKDQNKNNTFLSSFTTGFGVITIK